MASEDNNTTVVVIVLVSFGGLLLLACLAVSVCCCFKKKKERVDEKVNLDEHLKVKEAVVEGPNGPKSLVLEIQDDVHVHVDGVIHKDDKFGKAMHSNPLEIDSSAASNHSQLHNN
ncbi:protein TRACHEARY ELEMENT DIFFERENTIATION-RELATED 6 [Euphorbia lathyris]|uniref:protein TRACHEARY ELEMENT DIFFERENTIATION-RELATED 6 n=1 Tax=Euphorbia lathyris TaxID=212925 RepID=UPI003313C789